MATPAIDGKDLSGGALASNASMTGADAGQTYFDTSIGQLYVCNGSGTFPANFQTVGSAGNVAPGAAGSAKAVVKLLTGLTDNSFTTLATVTVPNAIMGAGIRVLAMGTLGDGDSTQCAEFMGAISRIAGAATGVTFGSATGTATNNGVTANASIAIQSGGNTGAISAQQTFTIQMKVTRSGGSSANHVLVASIELLNGFGSGITIA